MGPVTPRMLSGRYRVGGLLGVGGMGSVWQGHDTVLDREVAVKVLDPELAADPRAVDRFRREARQAARLNHPRIVTVHDSGIDGASPYIVMELVRGPTLREVLRGGPLPPDRAVRVAADVCEALQVAHAAGVTHGDVKPGNIMFTEHGEVKVVDFGVARTSATAEPGAVLGTASYLSPEQAAGAAVDGRADLYALGCVLAEMLTGEPPFGTGSVAEVLRRHLHVVPAAPSTRLAGGTGPTDLAGDLDAVVLRLLAKDPARRYASAGEARGRLLAVPVRSGGTDHPTTELRDSGTGRTTLALPPVRTGPPPAPATPAPAPGGRRDRRTPILVALGVAGLVATALIVTNGRSNPDPETPDSLLPLGERAAPVRVRYGNDDSSPNDNQIKPDLAVINVGSTEIPLRAVTVRYWFSSEGAVDEFATNCDFAAVGCPNVTHRVVPVDTRSGADAYLEVGFTGAAGTLASEEGTGEILLRVNKTDWSRFVERNDHSWRTWSEPGDSRTVTAYVNGDLVWGEEP